MKTPIVPSLLGPRGFRGAALLGGALVWFGAAAPIPAQMPATGALMLWLKADAGATTNASGAVVNWEDQSGQANHATGGLGGGTEELPLWAGDGPNGKPVVRFDGALAVLEIANSPSLQPQDGDWTVCFVARRQAGSQGDYPQIVGSRPWLAGADEGWAVCFDSGGRVCSHFADGAAGHDVPGVKSASSLSSDTFQMWLVEELRSAGTTSFYRNFDLDAQRATEMPADFIDPFEPVYLGREIGGSNDRRARMDLAELAVFNRALTAAERTALLSYLNTKYQLGQAPNQLPTIVLDSPADGSHATLPAAVTLSALATDSDGTVAKVDFYASGDWLATATAPPYRVPLRLGSVGTVSLTAVVTDDRGGSVTSAPVRLTVTGEAPTPVLSVKNGLALWLEADKGVTADASGAVSVWADQSGNHNNALQDDAGATPPTSYRPTLTAGAPSGKPTVEFDGAQQFLRIPNAASLQPGESDWTVLFVARRTGESQGDYPQILGSRPWTEGQDKGWAVALQNISGRIGSHFADGAGGHDVGSALSDKPLSSAVYQVWQVEEDRAHSVTRLYLSGKLDRAVSGAMPSGAVDQENDLFIGSEVEGSDSRRARLGLAEAMCYNRVLSETEREAVTSYLVGKWGLQQVSVENVAPAVTLGGVVDGGTLNAPASVTLTAEASDSDGEVVRVEFLAGGRSLGTVTRSPWKLATALTALGEQRLVAVATDNLGGQAASAPVKVRLVAPNVVLIGKVHYSDTFSVGGARADGLYNDNSQGAYAIEDAHGHPAVTWTPTANFSFNTPGSSTDPAKLGAAQGNSGAGGGLAQSGGGDFSIAYGVGGRYVVRVDAVLPSDRLDISSLAAAGDPIFAENSLSVFLRRDTATQGAGIGLFNGTSETAVTDAAGNPILTGIADDNWHACAVDFNPPEAQLKVYVDGVPLATVDLRTFGGGAYRNYANGAVGVGGSGGVFWLDNFQVGAPPEIVAEEDYRDEFTLDEVRVDGLYNDTSLGAYDVASTFGHPAAAWTPANAFSFNSPGSSTDPVRLEAAGGNSGAATGFAQSGGGDASFVYGLRDSYVVQVDAILPPDRLDIGSLATPGGGISSAESLTVFLRSDSVAGKPHAAFPETGLPAIGLYNGTLETAVVNPSGAAILLGVDDNDWHRYAVHFDGPNSLLRVYVDSRLLATVDLAAFGGGAYRDYSNGAVGVGGFGGVFWFDNVVVGSPASVSPTPATLTVTRQGGRMAIGWTGTGILEESASVSGPWTAVGGASSPYAVEIANGQRFYRLRQ